MFKETIHPVSFALMLGLLLTSVARAAGPNLAGWRRFDEGSGTVAFDSSGNGLDGTIEGAVWTEGQSGSALEFDGTDDAVRTPSFTKVDTQTVTAWIKVESFASTTTNAKQIYNGNGPPHMNFELANGALQGRLYTGSTNITLTGPVVRLGDWTHVAWAYDHPGNRSELFIDGSSVARGDASAPLAHTSSSVIGRHPTSTAASFRGVMDDVRVYSSALTEGEIRVAMKGAGPGLASRPDPAEGATDVPRDVVLSWTPGEFAATHDVYFGTVFDDVNDAGRANPRGVLASQGQLATTYDPPGRLNFGQTSLLSGYKSNNINWLQESASSVV